MPKAIEFHCEGKERAYASIIMTLQAELDRLRLIRTYALQLVSCVLLRLRSGWELCVYGRVIIAA